MTSYSIQDLAKITGIKAHTIRMWEKRYGVINPDRTETNIRVYRDQDLRRLLNLSILTRNGYRISKVAHLNDEMLGEKVRDITQATTNVSHEIQEMVVSMMEIDDQKFEQILSRAIFKYGFEQTFIKIIHPFFEQVGTLWQIGTINPAQEHFISNLVRQKLIVAIDSLDNPKNDGAKTFLLFLHQEELHELGLLFYYYMIKKAGHKVVYLGPQVPTSDLQEVARHIQPEFVFTAFVAFMVEDKVQQYITDMYNIFPDTTLFITGLEHYENLTLPLNIKPIADGKEFKFILDEL